MKMPKGLRVKTPPNNPELNRFTDGMRTILKAPKTEMNRRIESAKKGSRLNLPLWCVKYIHAQNRDLGHPALFIEIHVSMALLSPTAFVHIRGRTA